VALIVGGTVLLAIGLYRTVPLKFDRYFYLQNGPLAAILALACAIFFLGRARPEGSIAEWSTVTLGLAGRFLPLIILLCLVMGVGGILSRVYSDEIVSFLNRHHLLAPLAGSFLAPSPNTMVPLIEKLWDNRAFRPMFLYFLQAASLASLPLFMLRQLGFSNSEISIKMYLTGCIVAIVYFPFMRPVCAAADWIYEWWK
jgi:hypothetical protein